MGLFKGKLDVTKVFESATSGIDKLFLTNEEKADMAKKIADAQMEFVKSTIDENSARSVTRRYLSIGIMFVFLFLMIYGVAVYPFDPTYSDFAFTVGKELFGLTMMVAGFFFGGYMMKSNILPAIKKKEK